jgi:hypothetical protein
MQDSAHARVAATQLQRQSTGAENWARAITKWGNSQTGVVLRNGRSNMNRALKFVPFPQITLGR